MMKRLRPAIRSCSGLLLAGAVLFQVSFLQGQAIPIAVVEFEGNGISQTEAIALTDRLRNELFRLGAFEVVERGMMETILTEQDFQLTGCTSNDCLVEVGQLLGARQVVGGRISRVGAMFTVSARVVDVETGKLLGVSDFDLRGGLEEILTVGMKQVAVMLSMNEVEIELPDVGKVKDSQPQPQIVERQPTPTVESTARGVIYVAHPRLQIGYGIPLKFAKGSVLWGSWFPLRSIPKGRWTYLPAFTAGRYSIIKETYSGPYGSATVPRWWNHIIYYALLGSHLRYKGERIGLGGILGLGYGAGEKYYEYNYYDPVINNRVVHHPDPTGASGLVITFGGELTYRLWKIHLLLNIDYFWNKYNETFILNIGFGL